MVSLLRLAAAVEVLVVMFAVLQKNSILVPFEGKG
jgi:hypothetical protein